MAELFWIGVFSFTAKAAMSMSFEDDENPANVKLICLVGVIYSFFIDRSLFTYRFTFLHIQAGVCILSLCVAALLIQSRQHELECFERR